MKKLVDQCYSLFGKDYRFLKFIFTILATCLILEELYTYLVVKPTYTSESKRKMMAEDFPDIMFCPQPPVDVNALKSRGYFDIQSYFAGTGHGLTGWGGNRSEDVKQVFDDISALKSVEECPNGPESHIVISDGVSVRAEPVSFELTKALYPFHICCKIVRPQVEYPILNLVIDFSSINISFDSFKVFLSNKLTYSYFDLHKKIMLGDHIESGEDGIMNYKITIMEDEKLDDDPKYPCIDYYVAGKYSKCLEDEILRQNFLFLNCTPPWMTENENLWCKGKISFDSDSDFFKYINFMYFVGMSEVDPGKCLGIYFKEFRHKTYIKCNNLKTFQISLFK